MGWCKNAASCATTTAQRLSVPCLPSNPLMPKLPLPILFMLYGVCDSCPEGRAVCVTVVMCDMIVRVSVNVMMHACVCVCVHVCVNVCVCVYV